MDCGGEMHSDMPSDMPSDMLYMPSDMPYMPSDRRLNMPSGATDCTAWGNDLDASWNDFE